MTRSSIARLADCAPVASPESWPSRDRPTVGKYRTYHGGQGPKDWPAYIDDTPAMNAAHAALEAEAKATARAVGEIYNRIRALHGRKS